MLAFLMSMLFGAMEFVMPYVMPTIANEVTQRAMNSL